MERAAAAMLRPVLFGEAKTAKAQFGSIKRQQLDR